MMAEMAMISYASMQKSFVHVLVHHVLNFDNVERKAKQNLRCAVIQIFQGWSFNKYYGYRNCVDTLKF